MDLLLAGRNFYITGITGGIGRAIADSLRAEGALAHGCARSVDAIEHLTANLPADVREHTKLRAVDVMHPTALNRAVAEAASAVGRLDGVVACAGIGTSGGVLDTDNAVWEEQLCLKVGSVLNLFQAAEPWLHRSDRARAVIINGVTAHHPDPSMAAVSAGRAAVANLGRSLAVELASRVGVTVVNLGAIYTDRQLARWERLGNGRTFQDWVDEEVARREILSGRLGKPDEVASVVTFLLSPLANYITGTSLDVAGGSHGRV